MSKTDKMLKKLQSGGILKFNELKALLERLGYIMDTKGKTSGSRVAFYKPDSKYIIRFDKPHPGNEIPKYVTTKIILPALKLNGDIFSADSIDGEDGYEV